MAVGGIAINLSSVGMIEAKIAQIRDSMKITREVKWSNTRKRHQNPQMAYAELLHTLVDAGNLHFHVRFQRMQDWDHRLAGPRGKTDTVSKAFYQLLLHRPVAYYGDRADLIVYPDRGACTKQLHEYQGHLNTESRKRHGGVECVKAIHPQCSKSCLPLQLLDVTLGALAALKNGRIEGISEAKRELAIHVHNLWGNPDLDASSPKRQRSFSVWNALPGGVVPRR